MLNQVIRAEGSALLQYPPGGDGYPPLRAYLSSYLLRFGVEARAEDILVVNGSQQGFDLIARTFSIRATSSPWSSRPIRARSPCSGRRAPSCVPVPWDREGPSPTPSTKSWRATAQVPLLPADRPQSHRGHDGARAGTRLLDSAARHHVPIVEDGFDGSLYYGDRRPLPLRALDRDGLVLYIGTFSKVLFPGLRLGWLVAPPPVVERLRAAKQLADLGTSPLIQAAVQRFCERRLLDRHVARIAREYDRRRTALLGALERHMPAGVELDGAPRGLLAPRHAAARAATPWSSSRAAVRRGVGFTPGARFFVDGGGEGTARLSFSSVPVRRIDDGVRRLAEAIADWRRGGSPRQAPERLEALVV